MRERKTESDTTINHHSFTCKTFYSRHDLDGSAVKKLEKFPSPFRVTLEVEWNYTDAEGVVYNAASWQNLPYPREKPLTCFYSQTEQEEVTKQLGR